MVHGVFDENTPLVQLTVGWEYIVQSQFFVLDTGFTGDVQLTPKMASELGLEVLSVEPIRIGNGEVENMPTALAVALIEGKQSSVEVLISRGAPLVGINFLSKFGYRAVVDCKHKTVLLERV